MPLKKSKDPPSRETVQVRVSSAERLRYELRARELDLTLSDWLRLLARRDAGLWMPGGEPLKGDERAPCPGCAHNGDEGCVLVEQCQMREPRWGKYREKGE